MTDGLVLCHVITTLPIGGAEQHVLTVMRGIDRKRFSPLVCCLGEPGAIGREIEQLGTEVIALHRMRHKRWDWGIVRELVNLMKGRGVDIVHSHLYHANTYARIAAKIAGVKGVVATVHNVYAETKLKRRWVNYALAKGTDKLIAVSNAVRDDMVRYDWIDAARINVVYNGIDTDAFRPTGNRESVRREMDVPSDAFVIGCVSRLEPQKGHVFLLRAVQALASRHPSVYAVLVGDGSLRDQLRREADELGIGSRTRFLGARRDIPALFGAMDVFAMGSLWEGLPLAVLEAMASGLPVIATRVGGLSEVIDDDRSGRLVPPGDPQALAAAIESVLQHAEDRRALAAAGRRCVEQRFSTRAMIGRLEQLYDEVAERKGLMGSRGAAA